MRNPWLETPQPCNRTPEAGPPMGPAQVLSSMSQENGGWEESKMRRKGSVGGQARASESEHLFLLEEKVKTISKWACLCGAVTASSLSFVTQFNCLVFSCVLVFRFLLLWLNAQQQKINYVRVIFKLTFHLVAGSGTVPQWDGRGQRITFRNRSLSFYHICPEDGTEVICEHAFTGSEKV